MSTAAERKAAKRARRPVYMLVRKLIDPDTGALVGALVPAHPVDARLMRERKLYAGREVRAELKQPRNPAFHRLAHAVGHLMVDHVDGFESETAHSALKRVQRESGICCEPFEIDLGPLGKVQAMQARSLSFDEMDEGEFGEFFAGICDYIDAHYMHGLTGDVRGEYLLMTEGAGRRVA